MWYQGIEHHAYRRRDESGNRAFARRKREPEEARPGAARVKSERKRRAFGLRNGALPRDPVSRAVGETAGHVGPDQRIYPGQRPVAEEEGIAAMGGGCVSWRQLSIGRPQRVPPAFAAGRRR